jgi:acyl-coenzyme A synthetase/AMP-(fatty) acid ligase
MANDTHSVGFFAGEILDQTAARQPQKTAIITKEEELTFAALNQRVHALAGHLQNEGVKQGERVGVLLPNCAAIPLSYFATQKIGAVTVILDARLKGKELQGVLRDADLKLLIVHSQLLAEVREVFKEMAAVALWIVGGDGAQSFEKRYAAPATPPPPPHLDADDDALILYTSGTTGEPKGVVLSYRNLAQYPMVMEEMGITDASTMRGCILPMSHIVGPVVCNELAQRGYTLVIFDQINPVTLLEGIQRHRVTVFESVPIVFQLLLGVKNLASYDTRSVKIAAMMGTSIPLPLLRAFQTAQPHIKVIQGYGLTETSPMITEVEPEKAEAKMGSIGRAVPGVEIKIVDESGQEVAVGEPGEIITRGRRAHPRWMALYRRCRQARSRRLLLPSRPARRHDHHGRAQRLPGGGGKSDLQLSRGSGDHRVCYPRLQARASARRRRGGARWRPGERKRTARVPARQSSQLQGPGSHRGARIAAAHLIGKNHPRRRHIAFDLRGSSPRRTRRARSKEYHLRIRWLC